MFNFLRKLRLNNLNGRYFKYALGEIILVVIGILIALGINSLNEKRKENLRKNEYVQVLIDDLKKDSSLISFQNRFMEEDLEKINSISDRLSNSGATIDSVKKIYFQEFTGRFDASNVTYRNAYTILLSSGELNLFDLEFKNRLLNHYQFQDRVIQMVEENIELNLDRYKNLKLPPYEYANVFEENTVGIRGPLYEQILDTYPDQEFLSNFNKFLSNKGIMEENITYMRGNLLDSTQHFLNFLYTYQKKND